MRLTCLIVVGCILATGLSARGDEGAAVDFGRDVRPLLQARCFQCHDGRKAKGGLRLDVRSRALRGGESGQAAVVAKEPDKSELVRRVQSADDEQRMPPGKERLTAEQVALLRKWVSAGAVWPDALAGEQVGRRDWAYQAPKRPSLPAVKDAKGERNAVDRFVRARLEQEHWTAAPEAAADHGGGGCVPGRQERGRL
jgi:mono/diheme cytochrome c family protein